MALNKSTLKSKVWSPLKLWVLATIVLAVGAAANLAGLHENVSVTIVLASFLLFAAGNPILNSIKTGLLKNLAWSLPLFILHAVLTYLLLTWINHENATPFKQVFSTITVFYIMATTMSVFFRAISKYISEN